MSETALIDSVLDHHRRDGTRLVQILRETQERIGWLSPTTLTHIADAVGWPRAMCARAQDCRRERLPGDQS